MFLCITLAQKTDTSCDIANAETVQTHLRMHRRSLRYHSDGKRVYALLHVRAILSAWTRPIFSRKSKQRSRHS